MQAPPRQHERPAQAERRCSQCPQIASSNGARGLCWLCYAKMRRAGRLIDFPRRTRPVDDVMEDWAVLRAEGYSKRHAAERLGMSYDAFAQAHLRARTAGDPRALPPLTVAA